MEQVQMLAALTILVFCLLVVDRHLAGAELPRAIVGSILETIIIVTIISVVLLTALELAVN